MKLLENKYYPVNLEEKKIYDAPEKTLRGILEWGKTFCGIKGKEIMAHGCYDKFNLIPVPADKKIIK